MNIRFITSLLLSVLLGANLMNAESVKLKGEIDWQKYLEKIERLKKNKKGKVEKVGNTLKSVLELTVGDSGYITEEEYLNVTMSINDEEVSIDDEMDEDVVFEIAIESGEIQYLLRNKKELSNEALKEKNKELKDLLKERKKDKKEKLAQKLEKFIKKNKLERTLELEKAIVEGRSIFSLKLKKKILQDLIENDLDSLAGITLTPKTDVLLDNAMEATEVDPFALTSSSSQGLGVGVYISEWNGCPADSYTNRYINWSGLPDIHSKQMVSTIRAVSPSAYIYCQAGNSTSHTDQGASNGLKYIPNYYVEPLHDEPEVKIQNTSWTTYMTVNGNDKTLTEYSLLDREWDNQSYDDYILSVAAAANGWRFGDNVGSPAKAVNVLAVGNYDDSNDHINIQSSYINSQIKNNKPEVSAPGTLISAAGYTNSGTSFSAAHVSGFAADLLSKYTIFDTAPYLLKAFILASATDNISGGEDRVGVGGVNFKSAINNTVSKYWNISNPSYDSFTQTTDSRRYLSYSVHIPAGQKVYASLVWYNKGTYTYNHRTDTYPLGTDFDLHVTKPNGWQTLSNSDYDAYEHGKFTTTKSGTYRFEVERAANRDTSIRHKVALVIHWSNI